MSLALDPAILRPGDVLLYRPVGFTIHRPLGYIFGKLIALKTWHNISHVEVFAGSKENWHNLHGQMWHGYASEASRDGLGVDRYPLRLTELAYVLRPTEPQFVWTRGEPWFESVKGQKYDWFGLTRFVRTSMKPSNTKMFCSTFAIRRLRASGAHPVADTVDADSIAPGEILDSPTLRVVASDGQDPPARDGMGSALVHAVLGVL